MKRRLVKLTEPTGDYAEVDHVRLQRETRELLNYIETHIDRNKDEYNIWTRLVPLCKDVLDNTISLPVPFFSLPLQYETRERLLPSDFADIFSKFKITVSGTLREIFEEVVIDGVKYMYADFED